MVAYRSGHNEAHSKCVGREIGTGVQISLPPPQKHPFVPLRHGWIFYAKNQKEIRFFLSYFRYLNTIYQLY